MAKPRATRALWFSLPVCGRVLAVVEEAGVLDVAFLVVAGVATTALVTVVVEALAAELVAEEAAEPALDAVEEAEDAALEAGVTTTMFWADLSSAWALVKAALALSKLA